MNDLFGTRRQRRRLPLAAIVSVVFGCAGGFLLWAGFRPASVKIVAAPTILGTSAPIEIRLRSGGAAGLAGFRVSIEDANGHRATLESKDLPSRILLGSGIREHQASVAVDAAGLDLPEGQSRILVEATDSSPLALILDLVGRAEAVLTIDRTPPRITLPDPLLNGRRGGSTLAIAEIDADVVRSAFVRDGVEFPATSIGTVGGHRLVATLLPIGLDPAAAPTAAAIGFDEAGNRAEAPFDLRVKDAQFPTEKIIIDQAFVDRKIKPLLLAEGLAVPADPVEAYLRVNRDVRQSSEERLRTLFAVAGKNAALAPGKLAITDALQQPPNTQVGSRFAEARTYLWDGREVDQQTHLGYDLASTRQAPVPAAQTGRVVFVGPLGIYGLTVVIEHGLGLASLYAHLSRADVKQGDNIERGAILGTTGESGLAGGDHLHFSTLVHGRHVDALEWWDPSWVRLHILLPLAAAQTPATVEVAPPASAVPVDPTDPADKTPG